MKKNVLVILVFLFSLLKTEAQTWNLVWSDEFTNGPINTANWAFETGGGGWGNNELEYYTNRPENATITNGNLLIIARKELFGGNNYTSARMKTQGKKSWTYGKVEARIKIPAGKGIWPAFWMLGDNISQVGWPKCGEIDIMEHINSVPQINGTIHWDNNGHSQYGGDTVVNSTQYHIYAVEWDDTGIKWFLDGNKYWEANILNNINGTNEFHAPFFILLNLAIGGNWPGNPDASTAFPDTMFVDYVRVYQKSTTIVNENINKEIALTAFPNPTNESIMLTINDVEHGDYKVEIFDMTGILYFQKYFFNVNTEKISMPVSLGNFNSGIYLLAVRNKEKITCLKFIKD